MNLGDGVADLHMHTTASDGTSSVEERVDQARERDLAAIAITDHDRIPADLEDRVTHRGVLELVTGVEVRAEIRDTKIELLGYYVDPGDEQLQRMLETVRGYRVERNRAIIDRLHAETSIPHTFDDVRSIADGQVGRPHFARMLVDEGVVDSIGDAFDEYLGTDGAAFVPMQRVPAPEVLETLQDAGGVVSLAHPGRIRTDDVEPIVDNLVDDGLDAIEVPYPYGEAPATGYADVSVADAADIAETRELLWTGGSDCHGPGSENYRIGTVRLSRSHLDALRERAHERRPLETTGRDTPDR